MNEMRNEPTRLLFSHAVCAHYAPQIQHKWIDDEALDWLDCFRKVMYMGRKHGLPRRFLVLCHMEWSDDLISPGLGLGGKARHFRNTHRTGADGVWGKHGFYI